MDETTPVMILFDWQLALATRQRRAAVEARMSLIFCAKNVAKLLAEWPLAPATSWFRPRSVEKERHSKLRRRTSPRQRLITTLRSAMFFFDAVCLMPMTCSVDPPVAALDYIVGGHWGGSRYGGLWSTGFMNLTLNIGLVINMHYLRMTLAGWGTLAEGFH